MKTLLLLVLSMNVLFMACEKENNSIITAEEEDTDTSVHDEPSDYVWDNSDVTDIVLNGNSITVSSAGATVSGSNVTIDSAGVYNITGTLTNGQIIVNNSINKGKVVLILNGVSVTCSTSAPIYIEKAKKVIVYLTGGTQNSLTDATTYVYPNTDVDEPNAALFSKTDLTIFGEGTLSVKGNYKDGITSKDGLIVASGNITVNAADDGIRGKDYLIVKAGNISLTTGGDGLKSDNEDNSSLGYITILSGKLNIISGGDAIAAQTNVLITTGEFNLTSGGGSGKIISSTLSAKAIKGGISLTIDGGTFNISSADDALHTNGIMTINGGNIALASADDGLKAEVSITIAFTILTISKSYEGIESPVITIHSGDVNIIASDDGFNATKGNGGESNDGSILTINGGNIAVNVSGGDGLDSNGSIVMTAGEVIVRGPSSQPEVAIDYNGTFILSGGLVIASGPNAGNMIQGLSSSSTQNSLKIILTSNIAANTLFHIQDESGNDIVTFQSVRSFNYIVFSSPDLKIGSKYYVYTGGSSTGTVTNGLYSGGIYTPGTLYTSFTVSGILTSIGSSSSNPGGRP